MCRLAYLITARAQSLLIVGGTLLPGRQSVLLSRDAVGRASAELISTITPDGGLGSSE